MRDGSFLIVFKFQSGEAAELQRNSLPISAAASTDEPLGARSYSV
jgi:hypothetical protein